VLQEQSSGECVWRTENSLATSAGTKAILARNDTVVPTSVVLGTARKAKGLTHTDDRETGETMQPFLYINESHFKSQCVSFFLPQCAKTDIKKSDEEYRETILDEEDLYLHVFRVRGDCQCNLF
jgi:hypothetical protein